MTSSKNIWLLLKVVRWNSTCHQWKNVVPFRQFSAEIFHTCKQSMADCTPPELLLYTYMSTVVFPRFIVVFQDLHSGVWNFRDLDQALLYINLYSKRAQGLHFLLSRKCSLGRYSQWALAVKYAWINLYWCLNSSSFVSSACFLFSHWLSAKVDIERYSLGFFGCASPVTV